MDFKPLYLQLRNSLNDISQAEVSQLHLSFQNLLANLAIAFPEKKDFFNTVQANNYKDLMGVRARYINATDYFTGKGPVASKIKDAIGIHSWIDYQTHNPEQSLHKDELINNHISKLHEALTAFDFKPNTDPAKVEELNQLLINMRHTVDGSTFTKPLPPLTTGLPYLELKSGIYGDAAQSSLLAIILRATSPAHEGLIAYFISEPGKPIPSIFYYHPQEQEIIQSDGLITFDGIADAFKEQFQIALNEAGLIDTAINFNAEFEELVKISGEIFDQEEYLFDRFICDATGTVITSMVNQRMDWAAKYDRGEQASKIELAFPGILLLFANTRGAYPSRHHMLMRNLQTVVKVNPEELTPNVKLLIIQRTNQVFRIFKEVINFRKNQDPTKILKVEKL